MPPISKIKRDQIRYLARQCEKARQAHPESWDFENGNGFDFPDYGGLPERIADRLSGDCVDVIQSFAHDESNKNFTAGELEATLIEYAETGYDLPY